MTWIRLDDTFGDHPKIVGLRAEAFRTYVLGLCYASRFLTDGFVPAIVVARSKRSVQELIDAGLWTEDEDGIGYLIHDYLEHQRSRSQAEAATRAGKNAAHARWNANGNANGNAKSTAPGTASGTADGSASGNADLYTESEVEVEVEVEGGLGSQSTNGHNARANNDGPDLTKIAKILGSDEHWADRVAIQVLARAPNVTNPTAYVLAAIRSEPKRYQPTNGPPPIDRLCYHSRDRLTCQDCNGDDT